MNNEKTHYKSDWDEARERMRAWWAGEKTDRVPAYIVAPRLKKRIDGEIDKRVPEKFTDPDTVFRNLDLRLANNFWGGEAFPHHFVYFGAMFLVTFFGAKPKFYPNGAWYESPFNGWEDADKVQFDPDNRWWNLYRDIVTRSSEHSGGKYLTTIGGISAAMDVFAELFGTDKTLLAMIDMPDKMKELRDRIINWGKQTYDELYSIVSPNQDGCIDGMLLWAPDRVRTVQCDLCVTFSPGMFEEFVCPEIKAFWQHVTYGIYHLDGEEQIKHLDLLLGIDELDVIQFVPVTKKGSALPRDPMDHLPLFRRILESGKKMYILCPSCRVKPLLEAIPREGVFLACSGCRDEAEANEVLRTLDQLGM